MKPFYVRLKVQPFSTAPNLFAVIASYHQSAGMLSLEAQKTRFKVGSDVKVMVLDTTKNKLFLMAKPALMKSKLKFRCDTCHWSKLKQALVLYLEG